MFNADPFIANPNSSQDYNRYSYVRNNPLRYTDPSGYVVNGDGPCNPFGHKKHRWKNFKYSMKESWASITELVYFGFIGFDMAYGDGLNDGYVGGSIGAAPESYSPGISGTGIGSLHGGGLPDGDDPPLKGVQLKKGSGLNKKPAQYSNSYRFDNAKNTTIQNPYWNNYQEKVMFMYNHHFIGSNIPDLISVDINLGSTFVAGASTTYSVNLVTRGDPGIYLTRTEQERFGLEVDWGFNINFANYTGNPASINKQLLQGDVRSISGGFIFGGQGYFAYDFNENAIRWISVGTGVGFNYGGSHGRGKTYLGWW